MKVILGVDQEKRSSLVGNMLGALKFDRAQVELVHVLERVGDIGMPAVQGMRPDLIEQHLKIQEDDANGLLKKVQEDLLATGTNTTTKLLNGFSGNRLIKFAEETKADLLAIGSGDKGPIERIVMGSVGKKSLISAQCSVLIAKNQTKLNQPLNVVLATDHSDYAKRCIEKFIRWSPRGIGRIIVTTVFPEQMIRVAASLMENFKSDVATWIRKELEQQNQATIQKLAAIPAQKFSSRVETGPVGNALEKVMTEEGGDLLVLGAQGRGFVERMTVGSVSLEQALEKKYSTLVIRA